MVEALSRSIESQLESRRTAEDSKRCSRRLELDNTETDRPLDQSSTMLVLRGRLRHEQRNAGESKSVSIRTKFVVTEAELASCYPQEETFIG